MIKTTGIKKVHQPYLTRIENEDDKSIIINSSRNESEYLSPSELIQAGLAGCMTMTIKGALYKAGVSYNDVSVTVNMNVQDGKTVFNYHVDIDSDADSETLETIKNTAVEKCYVRNILASDCSFAET